MTTSTELELKNALMQVPGATDSVSNRIVDAITDSDLMASDALAGTVPARWNATSTALVRADGTADFTPTALAINPSGLALIGDSYFANGMTYTGSVLVYEGAQSSYAALNTILGRPWDLVYDGSVGGTNSSSWITNQLPGAVASSAATVLVGFPNNDAIGIGSYATTVANMTTIFTTLRAAGKSIIVATVGSLNTWTGAQRGLALQISDWIMSQASLYGWPVLDIHGAVYDPATGSGSTSVLLNEAGTYAHPSPYGFLMAARMSQGQFAHIPARPVLATNSPMQAFYGGMLHGDTAGLPNGFSSYTSGSPTSLSTTKVARTDSIRTLVRFTGTSNAAAARYGMNTAAISLTAAWSTGAKTLGTRVLGAFGDHWVCTTAGTSSGSAPAAMAAASSIGDTVTDSGGVVWTRFKTIVPGTTKITVKCEFDVTTVSGGDLGCNPVMLLNFTGGVIPGLRANNTANSTDAGQRWDFTKRVRPVISTPYQVTVPLGTTAMQLYIYQQWSAASVTSTFDVYGIESRLD